MINCYTNWKQGITLWCAFQSESSARNSFDAGEPIEIRRIKKHKREKHRLYYPDGIENIQIPVEKHHSRKRKRRSPDNNSEPELEQPRQGIKLFVSVNLIWAIFA